MKTLNREVNSLLKWYLSNCKFYKMDKLNLEKKLNELNT